MKSAADDTDERNERSPGKPKIEKMYIEGQVIEKVTEHRSW